MGLTEEKKIVYIPVEKLVLDECNIRIDKEIDDEFLESMKSQGIQLPLLVRPKHGVLEGSYGVVQGCRRYAAALKLGMEKVPCLVEEMDDVSALGRSLSENVQRRNLNPYEMTMAVAGMWNALFHQGYQNKEEIVKVIMEKTGLSRTSVQRYLSIGDLEEGIIRLMQPERDERVKDLVKKVIEVDKMPTVGILENGLDQEKAHYLSRVLSRRSYLDKLRCAIHIIPKSREEAFDFIDKVFENPQVDIAELGQKPKGEKESKIKNEHDKGELGKLEKEYIEKTLRIPFPLYTEIIRVHKTTNSSGLLEETIITALQEWTENKIKQLGLIR